MGAKEKGAVELDERITLNGSDYWTKRKVPEPIPFLACDYPAPLQIDITNPDLVTPNYQDAGAGTWKIIQGGIEPPNSMQGNQYVNGFSMEVSKRRKEMPFWHRNMDNDELIICMQGSVTWETDLGKISLTPGRIIMIPRGVSHRVIPKESPQYIAIEMKAPVIKVLHSVTQSK